MVLLRSLPREAEFTAAELASDAPAVMIVGVWIVSHGEHMKWGGSDCDVDIVDI